MKCQARQVSDQMSCSACGLVWDINDLDPPLCGMHGESFVLDGKPGVQDAPRVPGENLLRDGLPVVGYIDPEASFMLALKDGCVLSSHVDLMLVRDARGKYTMPLFAAPDRHGPRNARQTAVHAWCRAAFGDDHAQSVKQRAVRMVEEAIEAAQAAGVSKHMLRNLVEHIYSKPPGELSQEIGGVGVTILALAQAAGVSADELEQKEFDRVLSKPLSHFAARNEAKNAAGFDVTQE